MARAATVTAILLLSANASADTLEDRFPAPAGFTRVAAPEHSYGAWLRKLPLHPPGTPVVAFDGRTIRAPAAAVVNIDVGRRDLQQCADSIIRLRAEYLFQAGRLGEIAFHYTSGDRIPFTRWIGGEQPVVKGNRVSWTERGKREANHAELRRYLDNVFIYAGTLSLAKEGRRVAFAEIAPGDFFVLGGSPGHAVLVLDLATSPDGRKRVLLGQGFMPAQSFHVLRAPGGGAWFDLREEEGSVLTPSWPQPFPWSSLRRFEDAR